MESSDFTASVELVGGGNAALYGHKVAPETFAVKMNLVQGLWRCCFLLTLFYLTLSNSLETDKDDVLCGCVATRYLSILQGLNNFHQVWSKHQILCVQTHFCVCSVLSVFAYVYVCVSLYNIPDCLYLHLYLIFAKWLPFQEFHTHYFFMH